MMLAPIVLFIYNRPGHTEQTLNALMANDLADQSVLYVFADGPTKNASAQDLQKIAKTRELVKSKNWCKEIVMIEKTFNEGLADSIVKGVTEVLKKHSKVIVLEDDLITGKGFLKYMNSALTLYENENKVMHISGYMYPVNTGEADGTFFCNILSCWGWGTWARAWKCLELDPGIHLSRLRTFKEQQDFNIKGNADFLSQLTANANGHINTWAVKWYASWKLSGGYSLFPTHSLVRNIGHDGTGVNCIENSWFDVTIKNRIPVRKIKIKENQFIKKRIDNYYRKIFGNSTLNRFWIYAKLIYPAYYKFKLVVGIK